jgi:hypothetical protein
VKPSMSLAGRSRRHPARIVATLTVISTLAAIVALAVAGAVTSADAQTAYRAPRTPDGRPDLQGIWQVVNAAAWNLEDHNATLGVPAGRSVVDGGEIPYQPWALEKRRENFANRAARDPDRKCYLPGVPRITYMPHPFQIVYAADKVNLLYEYGHTLRHIYMNGNPHPDGPIEWWMGDSRGRWDGDTLVVDTVHFTADTWLDRAGNFHSEALHVTERFTRTGPDHMQYEVTLEDPKVFTRPWTMRMPVYRRIEPASELLEYECYAYMIEESWPRE